MPNLSNLFLVVGILLVICPIPFIIKKKVQSVSENYFKEIDFVTLNSWCDVWGRLYDYINRIVLFRLSPETGQKYLLYFELDIFTDKGREQYESTDWGGWNTTHFPLTDIERFKEVLKSTPPDDGYINEWRFTVDRPLKSSILASRKMYKRKPIP